jgi:hypothetical protein
LPIAAAAGLGSSSCDPRGYGGGIPHYETADVQQASIRAIQALLDAGADVNSQGPVVSSTGGRFGGRSSGQTALHGAINWGWTDVIRFLVDNGARIDLRDADGRTVYQTAIGGGRRGRGDSAVAQDQIAMLLRELCAEQADCDVDALAAPQEEFLRGR